MSSTIVTIRRTLARRNGLRAASAAWTALVATALGAGVIYLAGFAEVTQLHNAAHDARHTAGFPCH